jgi:putative ABC transport system substrate-binding protein
MSGLVARPGLLRAQNREAPRRLGILGLSNPVAGKAYFDALAAELAKRGWVEGSTLATTYAYADGDASRMDVLAVELLAGRPDVVHATSAVGALALQRVTRTVPIVFAYAYDPVGLGLVKSLAQPGGNVTGISAYPMANVSGKNIQILKEWLPRLSRLAVVYGGREPSNESQLEILRHHATEFGLTLKLLRVNDASEVNVVLAELQPHSADAVYLLGSALNYAQRAAICRHMTAARLPAITSFSQAVDDGCLMSYGASYRDSVSQAAGYIDKILRGQKPGELPVSDPSRFELVINARTARAIGLAIPQSLLLRADRVIE